MTEDAQPSASRTITVAATTDEIKTAIEALLPLGTDVPSLAGDLDENAALVPLFPQIANPDLLTPAPEPPVQPTNNTPVNAIDDQPKVLVNIGTAVKIENKMNPKAEQNTAQKKKKTFVTVEYKLKCKYTNTKRKFPCEKCRVNFGSQKEVNEHFRTSHPLVQCDICEKTFDTPSAVEFFTVCTKLAEMAILYSKDLTTAKKKLPSVGLDLMLQIITGLGVQCLTI